MYFQALSQIHFAYPVQIGHLKIINKVISYHDSKQNQSFYLNLALKYIPYIQCSSIFHYESPYE